MTSLTTDAHPTSTKTLLPIPTRRPCGLAQTLDRIDMLMAEVPCRGRDRDDWFSKSLARIQHAKRACGTCPVRAACLRAALDLNDRNGVWGGLGPEQRTALRRRIRAGELDAADLETLFAEPDLAKVAA